MCIYIYIQAISTLGLVTDISKFLELLFRDPRIHEAWEVISSTETMADFLHIRCMFDFGKNWRGDMMSYFRVFVESLLAFRIELLQGSMVTFTFHQ